MLLKKKTRITAFDYLKAKTNKQDEIKNIIRNERIINVSKTISMNLEIRAPFALVEESCEELLKCGPIAGLLENYIEPTCQRQNKRRNNLKN